MCGFFGSIGEVLHEVDIQRNKRILHPRGPDDNHCISGMDFTFGFVRLSILDLSNNGRQPFVSADKRYVLVFNGEIFNYIELRKRFLSDFKFIGNSDTEVLLNLLILKGAEAIQLLNGMFSFVFFDTLSRNFLLARDRFGIKPFYYEQIKETIHFGSLPSVLPSAQPDRCGLSVDGLRSYIGLGYVSGGSSIFKGIKRLMPGNYLQGNQSGGKLTLETVCYWRNKISPDSSLSRLECTEKLELMLIDSIKLRLRSDVPTGIFLSGGIDSGLVASIASKFASPTCYTIGFGNSRYDESNEASLVAKSLGLNHEIIPLEKVNFDDIMDAANAYDEPFADSSAIPSFLVSKTGSKNATVFLTGDGGDEVFGGYNRYIKRIKLEQSLSVLKKTQFLWARIAGNVMRQNSSIQKLLAPDNYLNAFFDNMPGDPLILSLFSDPFKRDYLSLFQNFIPELPKGADTISRMQLSDYLHYLPDDILVKMDRASMANSIEVRSPFMDYRIHDLAGRFPREWLINKNQGKLPLRQIAEKYLPKEILMLRKKGFSVPLNEWTKTKEFIELFQELLQDSEIAKVHLVKQNVKQLADSHFLGRDNYSVLVWRLFMLFNWERRFNPKV